MTNSNLVGLHRQVGGLFALENMSGVDADLAITILNARSIAYQTARHRGRTGFKSGRNGELRSEPNQQVASAVQERAGAHKERVTPHLSQPIEGRLDCAFVACFKPLNREAEGTAARFDVGMETFGRLETKIDEYSNGLRTRNQLMQESEPLRGQDTGPNRDPGDISTGV